MIHQIKLKNGIGLEVLDQGEGEVVLLIHGLGSNKADWDLQKNSFSEEYRILAPDLRGHGNSTKPQNKDAYGIPQIAEDMKLLLQELGIEHCMVVGFSMGGAIAFEMAVTYKNLITKMVIVNTAPDFDQLGNMGQEMITERTAMLQEQGISPLAHKIAESMFPEKNQGDLRNIFYHRLNNNAVFPYYHSFITLMEWGIGDKIKEIEIPVLVVASDMDYTPVSLKKAYTQKMPNARLEVVKNSRHGVTMDQPQKFNQILLNFFNYE